MPTKSVFLIAQPIRQAWPSHALGAGKRSAEGRGMVVAGLPLRRGDPVRADGGLCGLNRVLFDFALLKQNFPPPCGLQVLPPAVAPEADTHSPASIAGADTEGIHFSSREMHPCKSPLSENLIATSIGFFPLLRRSYQHSRARRRIFRHSHHWRKGGPRAVYPPRYPWGDRGGHGRSSLASNNDTPLNQRQEQLSGSNSCQL